MILDGIFVIQDYKTYLDFVLAMENRKEPQVIDNKRKEGR